MRLLCAIEATSVGLKDLLRQTFDVSSAGKEARVLVVFKASLGNRANYLESVPLPRPVRTVTLGETVVWSLGASPSITPVLTGAGGALATTGSLEVVAVGVSMKASSLAEECEGSVELGLHGGGRQSWKPNARLWPCSSINDLSLPLLIVVFCRHGTAKHIQRTHSYLF